MANPGFYKRDGSEVIYAPFRVVTPTNFISSLTHLPQGDPVYPIDGWYWFDSVSEAFQFLGVPFIFETSTQLTERLEAGTYAKLIALKNMSPTQVQNFVENNVTTLATAKDAIKTLAVAVSILARRL